MKKNLQLRKLRVSNMIRIFFLRIPVNYLILNLAVADLTTAILFTPEVILSHISSHPEGVTGMVLCSLLTDSTFAWIGGGSSVITLVAITVERYYAVIYPLGNKGNLTTCKLKVCHSSFKKQKQILFKCYLVLEAYRHKKFMQEWTIHISQRVQYRISMLTPSQQ